MNVSLTPELEQLVQDKVSSGLYNSASEVVREALRLLQERDEVRKVRLEELRREIARGVEAADRGELVPAAEVFESLRQRNAEVHRRQG
jgi:antitoxin ParD1/3/4